MNSVHMLAHTQFVVLCPAALFRLLVSFPAYTVCHRDFRSHCGTHKQDSIVIIACQARGGAAPANDLQSQLDDMLDDSASDNSSSVQMRGGANPPLPPAAPTTGDRPQDRGLNPNLGAKKPELQQMLSILEDEAEVDMQDLGVLGQQSNQQSSEMSNQLQVSLIKTS